MEPYRANTLSGDLIPVGNLSRLSLPLLTFALAASLSPPASAFPGDIEEVIANAREAAGRSEWLELDSALSFAGRAQVYGVEDSFNLTFGYAGEYRFQTGGPLANTSTWDGVIGWTKDASGPSRQVSLESLDQSRLSQWVHSGYWCSGNAPLQISLANTDSETVELAIGFESSHSTARLLLDPQSWLPRELHQASVGGEQSLLLGDYREVAGIPIAHRVTFRGGGVDGFVHIANAKVSEPLGAEHYSLRSAQATDTTFRPELPSAIDVRRSRSGHLLVQVVVNRSAPQWFILDTGAGKLCIDPRLADELDLKVFGQVPAVGIGGTVVSRFRQGASIALGPMEISNPVFLELDLAFLEPHLGVVVSGICGYDLFARSVFELDLGGPTAALFDPSGFELEDAAWQPMLLNANIPCIEARFEGGHSGYFAIDTGDAGTVSFHSNVVTRLDLLKGRVVEKANAGGVGGMVGTCKGKLDWIKLGGKRFEAIEASFGLSEKGVRSRGMLMGTLGSQLLHPFVILFDYSGSRIALIPK